MNDSQQPQRWNRQELCYCSNVHPSDSLELLEYVISNSIPKVRCARKLNLSAAGLWLSGSIANELSDNRDKRQQFFDWLERKKVIVFTLNGFPFGNFHSKSVKQQVYVPDWSNPKRANYTWQLAQLLVECLPDSISEGTISTLPLGFRHSWSEGQHQKSLVALCRLAEKLAALRRKTGRTIRVCLEMEPSCVLETTDEMIAFLSQQLPEKADDLGIEADHIKNHLGVCFDVCHQAVMFEDIEDSLSRFLAAGITIGKIQISSALEIKRPDLRGSLMALKEYDEEKYLHQVRTLNKNHLTGTVDLPGALNSDCISNSNPWRVHFHVPIQAEILDKPELTTTQDAIKQVLDFLQKNPDFHPHLEVETYTWSVLPSSLRPNDDSNLADGIAQELDWLEKQLSSRGLLLIDNH